MHSSASGAADRIVSRSAWSAARRSGARVERYSSIVLAFVRALIAPPPGQGDPPGHLQGRGGNGVGSPHADGGSLPLAGGAGDPRAGRLEASPRPLPGAGEGVAVLAEPPAEHHRGSLLPAPDRERVVADLPRVVERVPQVVVDPRGEVGALRVRPELPLVADDLDPLDDPRPVHEVDALHHEVPPLEPLEGDLPLRTARAPAHLPRPDELLQPP